MKDELIDQLQQRFTGHEVEVDAGLWDAISGKLAASTGDGLQEVLRDKFTGHEVPVDAHVWTNISSQLGHGAAAGGGAATWLAGGLAAAAVVGGLAWWLVTGEQPAQAPSNNTPAQMAAVPAQQTPAEDNTATVEHTLVVDARTTTPEVKPTPGSSATGAAPATTDSRATTSNETTTAPASEGERTVNTVLGTLVQQNATEPHFPDAPEPVPAPPADVVIPTFTPEQVAHQTASAPADMATTPEPEDELLEGDADEDNGTEDQAGTALEPRIYIPNVFSPQGDGVNDKLKVVGSHYQRVSVRIISARTDALVFRSNNLDDQWNGRDMNNVPCEEGYYFYAIEVTGLDGVTYSKGEVIRLFR